MEHKRREMRLPQVIAAMRTPPCAERAVVWEDARSEDSSMDATGSKEKAPMWDQRALHLTMRLPVCTDELCKSLDLLSVRYEVLTRQS